MTRCAPDNFACLIDTFTPALATPMGLAWAVAVGFALALIAASPFH